MKNNFIINIGNMAWSGRETKLASAPAPSCTTPPVGLYWGLQRLTSESFPLASALQAPPTAASSRLNAPVTTPTELAKLVAQKVAHFRTFAKKQLSNEYFNRKSTIAYFILGYGQQNGFDVRCAQFTQSCNSINILFCVQCGTSISLHPYSNKAKGREKQHTWYLFQQLERLYISLI